MMGLINTAPSPACFLASFLAFFSLGESTACFFACLFEWNALAMALRP